MSLSTAGISLTTATIYRQRRWHRWKIYHVCHREQCKSGERCRPPLSTMPVVNLSPVLFLSTIHLELRISSRLVEKFRQGSKGLGEKIRFSDWEISEPNSDAAAARFMLFRGVSPPSLIRYPSTFQHSPAKIPISLLSCPSLFLATHIPFWHPYLLFDICTSSFLTVHRPSELHIGLQRYP
jgi:hypothetical protein